MPANPNAVVIGQIKCPTPGCSERAAVLQNSRDYLYTRCSTCGADQRNGVAAQVYFWQHMEPKQGAVVLRPRNVPESAGDIGCALRGEAPGHVQVERSASPDDTGAGTQAKQVQASGHADPIGQKPEKKKAGGPGAVLLIGLGLVLAAFAGGSALASGAAPGK